MDRRLVGYSRALEEILAVDSRDSEVEEILLELYGQREEVLGLKKERQDAFQS